VLSLVFGNIPFRAYQPCSVWNINHARFGMIHQASHQGLQHPLKKKFLFPSATVIIWASQYDHELTTLPRVYASRSCVCPLFHPRNNALLFQESLALSLKSPGSSSPLTYGGSPLKVDPYVLILWALQYLHRAHHLDKSQLVAGTCACPLLLYSSRVLMLHKSLTYCPRHLSSSSLIFNMSIHESQCCICLHARHNHFIGYTPVHSYLAITLVLGLFWTGLLSWPSHLL
jgi:hypothetical protein